MCSDLYRALFDLVAARGVESRGLLEEELSGCLERLRGRNRDDQMFIMHTRPYSEIFAVLNNSTLIKVIQFSKLHLTSKYMCASRVSNNTLTYNQTFFNLDKTKAQKHSHTDHSLVSSPFAKLSGLISST